MNHIKTWEEILIQLNHRDKRDTDLQAAFDTFSSLIAPTSYKPYIEHSEAAGFIEGLVYGLKGDEELKEDLNIYLYDKDCKITDKDGTEYNFKKDKDVIKYFNKFWPL